MSKKKPAKFTDLSVARQKVELEKAMRALQENDELCIPINDAQAAIRTDMEFSLAETKYILECLHTFMEISKETYQFSETDEEAEAGREAAEEFAAFIDVIEKAKALSKNGKYVIPMTFWEMDAFLSPFEMERETFDIWSKTELRQRKKYVDVVTDIDERFKPVYNQRRDGAIPIFAWTPTDPEVEDYNDEFDFKKRPPIESELKKDIDIELAATDTESILTCLTQTQESHEEMGAEDDADAEMKDFHNKSVVMLLQIIAKIEAAKSASVSATYTVHITIWELEALLDALESEIDMMQVWPELEDRAKIKYYYTIETAFYMLRPAYIARYEAIWPKSNATYFLSLLDNGQL